ncbi:MAG TPA: hypothetical protein VF723_06110 [Pyrinomonadaceae bacterium]
MLRSADETTMNWASFHLFKIDEKRALDIIRPMLQSGNEAERYWASKVLSSRGYLKFQHREADENLRERSPDLRKPPLI